MESCRNTTDNRRIVANYIRQKTKLGEGGMVPASFLKPVQTDMDVFPYDRFFRGMVGCDRPRVFDREAGHRRLNPAAYAYQYSPEVTTPRRFEGCFQIPCSTILPCVPDTAYKQPTDFCVNISP